MSLAAPFILKLPADHVDFGGLGVPVLLVSKEVTKLAYRGKWLKLRLKTLSRFFARLVANFREKIDAVTTDICPAFSTCERHSANTCERSFSHPLRRPPQTGFADSSATTTSRVPTHFASFCERLNIRGFSRTFPPHAQLPSATCRARKAQRR